MSASSTLKNLGDSITSGASQIGSSISKTMSSVGSLMKTSKTTNIPDKKGEIQELKQLLSDPTIDNDQTKKREVLQRVIGFTTMGLDTSKLFDRMIMGVNTKDIVQKKMIYQYITHYARQNADLAILVINTLARDCRDESPIVRGLALRSLSSLRISKLTEHLVPLIKEGLNDPSPYVRRAAVVSVSKLFKIAPQIVKVEKFDDRMYDMIQDKDAQVIVNSIRTLNEIEESGVIVSKKMVYHLLNKLSEYTEWQLTEVVSLLLKYKPESNDEIFDIMNLLDDKLEISNASVVMSITNLFLHYTQNMPKNHIRVYSRLRDPLLLLFATSSPELAYTILQHLKFMMTRSPHVFQPYFKDFYIKYNDPSYLKELKLEVLTLLANEKNVQEIMSELSYYVSLGDNTVSTSKKAIRALGEIAVKVTYATDESLTHLLEFLDTGIVHIISETTIVLKDILRKYNDVEFCKVCLPSITRHWRTIEDPEALSSFVWMLGEFGKDAILPAAPYILENFIDNFSTYHYSVRNQILTSAMKLFFLRAPEMVAMLGRLFEVAVNDTSHADVHDRALFYYRLLSANVDLAKSVVMTKKDVVTKFAEEESVEFRDRLFSEFNTLSIIYGKPSERFIVKDVEVLGQAIDDEDSDDEGELHHEEAVGEEEVEEEEEEEEMKKANEERLLDDDLDYEDTNNVPIVMPPALTPAEYQQKWKSSDFVNSARPYSFSFNEGRPSAAEIEEKLRENNILTMASNVKNEPHMFYFYTQTSDLHYILIECKMFQDGKVAATFRSSDASKLQQFAVDFEFIVSEIQV
ncbi:hypothetical protein FDP41_005460 [Naegleria fowleri]|uniref:AP complex subunit beta n=1 Tax=Naegleria fowleri TaxID=5763 RepID=A0A6A5BKR3_NAEFO|nr:uncharacterized protein FDP41_005460 [Naegleria fowleri]KAF0975466.1 hypothetical protein FDP41_005460 [Naegleria fowleri]